MTLSQCQSNFSEILEKRVKNDPYVIINLAFTGILLLFLAYFLFFSPEKNSYPVPCIHEKITGEQCLSCGLSHSLSLIMRGRFQEAGKWNSYGVRVFIFFVAQLLMRIFFSGFYIANQRMFKQLVYIDIAGSFVLFLLTFMPFLKYIFRWLLYSAGS